MNRYRFLDVDVTCLEDLSSKPSLHLFFKTRFYAVVSVSTPASAITSQETPLANTLGNKTHAWKHSTPLRFNSKVSKFHDDCSMLVIQLRRRRPFRADRDVGEALVVPVIELFENAENNKASRSNVAVYGVEYANDGKDFGKKKQQVYFYFSYKFSNSSSVVGQDFRINGSSDDDEGVLAAAWRSNSNVVRKYRDAYQRFFPLEDSNRAVYQLLFVDNKFFPPTCV